MHPFTPRTLMALLSLTACSGAADAPVDPTDDPVSTEPLQATYELPDTVATPEGVAFHAPTRGFYMGSLGHGKLQRMEADGTVSDAFDPEQSDWSSLGVKVHPDDGTVLVCAVRFASTPDATSELWVHTPDDARTERHPLVGAPSNCNDLAADGDVVYLSDRESARIHRVDLATGAAEIWLEHPELTPGLIGNNGVELTEDGDALIVGQFAPARLLHVPLDSPGDIAPIALDGDGFGFLPNGADGIAWVDGKLIVAAHGSIARVASIDGWASATVFAAPTPADIVAVTEAEGALYGLNGEVIPFVLGLEPDLPFELLELPMP